MKATGNTKVIMKKVQDIQGLIGEAQGCAWNDRDPERMTHLQDKLNQAMTLCLEITNLYDPI